MINNGSYGLYYLGMINEKEGRTEDAAAYYKAAYVSNKGLFHAFSKYC